MADVSPGSPAADDGLRDRARMLTAIIENTGDAIFIKDREGRIILANTACAQAYGRASVDDIVGKCNAELFGDSAMLARAREDDEQVMGSRQALSFEYHLPEVDRWMLVNKCPYLAETGEVIGVVGISVDITQRKRAELELAKRVAHLEELDQLKDQFLSILSHELRTPLNAIVGFGSLLVDEVEGEPREFAQKVLVAADLLLGMIDDLLTMSRIQAGKLTLARQPMDVADMLEETLHYLRPTAAKKRQTITSELAPGLPFIDADGQRVRQVVSNLVGNAIKFTPEGGRITVRARAVGDGVRVEVADDGPGILPAHQARLFRRFQQVDMSATRHAGGAGLGLSIVKALVDAHGGTVGVESEPGHGATFWFELPVGDAKAAPFDETAT